MAIPEIIDDIEIRVSRGNMFAYADGKLIGHVETVEGKIAIFPIGKKFRGRTEIKSSETLATEEIARAIYALAVSVKSAFPADPSDDDEPEQAAAN